MKTKRVGQFYLPVVAVVLAAASFTVAARPAPLKEDMMQLKADKQALQRQIKRLEVDEAQLKSDTASGRMSAESKDGYVVYLAKNAIRGEKKDIAHDKAASPQMKEDKDALHRKIKQLKLAEMRLKTDTAEGKMSAMSPDAESVYKDRQGVKAEKRQITADKAKLKADEKK